jgi:Ca2+/H+ antiporter, TMEM165/GDT1 family
MRPRWAVMTIMIPLFAIIFVAGFGSAVWQVWNHVMPQVFGLPAISFWQAVGLLALSWLLFGGFRGPFGAGRRGMRRRWEGMTPEQRDQFRQAMAQRCGQRAAAETPKVG